MDFTKKFKGYSHAELLKIINSPGEYQPQAVETAKTIFASWQLSEADIEIAKAELTNQQKGKEAGGQKNHEFEMQMKNTGTFLLSLVNPAGTEATTAQKRIKIICLFICGLFIFQIYKEYGMLRFLFTRSREVWDFSMVVYYMPFQIIPIVTILFFKHKKIGWTLMASYATYSALSSLSFIFMTNSVLSPIDSSFTQPSPFLSVLEIAFWGGILWTICKPDLREIYTVDSKYMYRTLGLVAALTLLIGSGMLS